MIRSRHEIALRKALREAPAILREHLQNLEIRPGSSDGARMLIAENQALRARIAKLSGVCPWCSSRLT